MANINDIDRVIKMLAKQQDVFQPSKHLMAIIERNNRLISQMFLPYQNIARQMELIQNAIRPQISVITQMQSVFSGYQAALPNMMQAFQVASAVFDSLKAIDFHVPNYLNLIAFDSQQLISASRQLRDYYESLLSTVSQRTVIPDLASSFVVKPSLSVSSQFRALRSLGFIESSDYEPLERSYQEELSHDWSDTEYTISTIDRRWLTPLKGAEEALSSSNPDKVRHAITSLRELLTHILHRFAPDDLVRERLPESNWYSEGKPTRRARLYFILERKYGNTLLLDFIQKDIEAILEMFQLYQQGTHELVSNINAQELKFIVARTKVLIGELIVYGKETS